MNFKDLLPKVLSFSKKSQVGEYYFALNVEEAGVTGAVWGLTGKRFKLISVAQAPYKSHEQLIEAANFALDEALADFQPEPTKILFGVPDSWLQDDDLKPEYLKLLRQMVKELDVVPMAYVSSSHSICHLLQKQTGVPVTGILVAIGDPLQVTVVKAGKIVGTKTHRRTDNLPEDIEKALLAFPDIEVMPSKMLIYGGSGNLTKLKEELLSYSWMAQLPFLHLPRIDQLDDQIAIKAISFAGASEIYPDINLHPHDLTLPKPQDLAAHSGKLGRPIMPIAEPNGALHHGHRGAHTEEEDSGFVAGDITDHPKKGNHQPEETAFGFEEEPADHRAMTPHSKTMTPAHHNSQHEVAAYNEPHHGRHNDSLVSKLLSPLSFIPFNKFIIIPVVLLAILIGIAVFLPKAAITVFVDLRTLEKEATVVADPTVSSVDEPNKKIPGKVVTTSITGSAKGQATGKRKIGDPAKGAVVIYNKTDSPKTLAAGTVLDGPSSLKFKLDSSVTIASQSGVRGGVSFGKATANVTAVDIGPEGNLAAGKEMAIPGVSKDDLSADVDTAFTGGVSKDVTVVTSDDQKRLLASLTSELRTKAKDQIQSELEAGAKVLAEGLSEKITRQTYSKKVNDQASEFSLDLGVTFTGTSYKEEDLKLIVSKLVETNVPDGYTLDLTKTETQADVSSIEKDGRLIFSAKFKAKLMPKFEEGNLKKELAGKSVEDAATRLKQVQNVIGSNIEIKPSLPGPLKRLPLLPQNITLEVTAK